MSKQVSWIKMKYVPLEGKTWHLTDEQYGLLHRLFGLYLERGPFPDDVAIITKWLHRTTRQERKVREVLDEFFFVGEGGLLHSEWIDTELQYISDTFQRKLELKNGKKAFKINDPILQHRVENLEPRTKSIEHRTENQEQEEVTATAKEDLSNSKNLAFVATVTSIYDLVSAKGTSCLTPKQLAVYNKFEKPAVASTASAKQVVEQPVWVNAAFKHLPTEELREMLAAAKSRKDRMTEYNALDEEIYNRTH